MPSLTDTDTFCRRTRLVLPGLGLCISLGASAAAPSAIAVALPPEAQAAIAQGVAAAKRMDYDAAIRFFQAARQIAPMREEIFRGLGEAESRIAGREMRAACWYVAYLVLSPQSPDADAVRKEIARLRTQSRESLLAAVNDVRRAVGQTPDPGQYRADLATLCLEAGDFTSALQEAGQIKDPAAKDEVLLAICDRAVSAGETVLALRIPALMAESIRKDQALGRIAQGQAMAGSLEAALATAALIQDGVVKEGAWLQISQIQLRAGDFSGVRRTAGLMANPGRPLGLVAEAQAQQGEIATAKATVGPLAAQPTTIRALGAIAVAQAKLGDMAGMQATLRQATEMADHMISPADRSSALAEVARAQGKTGDVAGAIRLLDSTQRTSAKDSALQSIAMSLAINHNFADALSASVQMINQELKNEALDFITEMQAGSGDIAGAKSTANLISSSDGYFSDAQFVIALSEAKAGNFTGAKAAAGLVADPESRSLMELRIAEAQAGKGDLAGASQTLASAKQAASLIQMESYKSETALEYRRS